MRPQRFQDFALDLAKNAPAADIVTTLAEAGDTKHPFGLAVKLGGTEVQWQVIAELAPGDKHSVPEAPVEGDPMAPIECPQIAGSPSAADAERWLASLLSSSGNRELCSLELWSQRPDARPGHHGLTARFHSGAKIYVRSF
ncbi:hypothetical protein [Streptomyces sp. XD-27]|uniref:hypothetical protein n=1 Tax=Streptomyces sp. XD-27 TaxID=3062779 RepID=UPI0026F46C94|nr:hypothetical protein [Streptomyces sp. XD-27]WKX73309.1 hypothetical protein Q3Y56_28490 [Streptomyces sp. XD-27]